MSLAVAGALWAGWVGCGIARERIHQRRLHAIDQRVLVAGMRGKSTLVRLIHLGLRESGHRAIGRVSGDAPLLLLRDGSELPSPRRSFANVREMRALFGMKELQHADSVVLENMAVRPELQEVVTRRIVCPTLQVLSSDAPDHLDVFPLNREARAKCTLDTLDPKTPLIITPSPANEALLAQARLRGIPLVEAAKAEGNNLRPFMAAMLGASEAALAVLGADDADALAKVRAEALRLQTLRSFQIASGPRMLDFLSANDPASTLALARLAEAEFGVPSERCALLYVHRADRATRLISFAPLFERYRAFITGDRPPLSVTWQSDVRFLPRLDWSDFGESALVFLGGNATKTGAQLRERLAAEGEAQAW